MKHQYFGDTRDLFKYDIIHHLLSEVDSLKRFTFIPMLTENDDGRDGNKVDYKKAVAGTRNDSLINFLGEHVESNSRNIFHIEKYFKATGMDIAIHKSGENYFSNGNRSAYFSGIKDGWLNDALVFADPDNGLEVTNSNHRHITYQEVAEVYSRMNDGSIFMIYQHFPRIDHMKYLSMRSMELSDKVGDMPIFISDNEIIFFFLSKIRSVRERLENSVLKYRSLYPKLIIGNTTLKWT